MEPKKNDIVRAKEYLDQGALVAIPTETVYGLAANGTSKMAIQKIYKAKGRPSSNPLILHFPNLAAMQPYVGKMTEEVRLLANAFWPGPLTLLLPKSDLVLDTVTAGLPRVAVRVPNHPKTLELLRQLDFPLAAPSANPSGYISPTKASHVKQQLGNKIAMVLDGGECTRGLESTILGWDETGHPTIYRKGVITAEAIENVLHKLPQNHISKTLEAPGMLSLHYSPNTTTIISANIGKTVQEHPKKTIGLISFHKHYQTSVEGITNEIVLSTAGSLNEVAKKLYAAMYTMDNLGLDVIVIEKVPETGIGKAINDRLVRSAQ